MDGKEEEGGSGSEGGGESEFNKRLRHVNNQPNIKA